MYFSFDHDIYLYLLFFIPVLIFFHFYNLKSSRGKSLKFANFDSIARVKGIDIYSKGITVLLINIIIVFLISFSLSGITLHREIDVSSFSFVIAIDASRSMEATDLKPNRLLVAKEASIDFVDSLSINSRLGVVSFAGNTYIQEDITEDKSSIIRAINNVEINEYGGTDIFEAVSISLGLLKFEENKAIILLSDGQVNVGNIYEIIELARENNVVIHTVGIGTIEGGSIVYGISKLDEESLKALAYNSGGEFFKAGDREELLQAFIEIAPLTKRFGEFKFSELLAVLAVILFVIEQTIFSSKRISI